MNSSIVDKVNNKKFKSGIEAQKQLLQLTRSIQDQLLKNLPSNYPKDRNTNLAEFFRAVSKEFARLQISSSEVNEDKYNDSTRTEYLFQILGDSLFLGEKAINENLSDVSYRDFLLKVRNAYYEGSRKQNLEGAVSDIIGLPVVIKELYLDLRKKDSSYGLKDTHKMFFDILMDNVTSASSIGVLLEDIKFFIDIIKPAHTLYDTRLIWNETFTNRSGTCTPSYIKEDMSEVIYGTSLIYLVTYLSTKIYKVESGTYPAESWVPGTIQSINLSKGIYYLTDNKILVYNSSTLFYRRNTTGDTTMLPDDLIVGDTIYYYATKDAAGNSSLIDNSWQYSGTVSSVHPTEELVILLDGSGIVFNSNTLVYTRDYAGEYRIDIGDLGVGREIAFKADKNTQSYKFFRTPTAVQDNFYKQFDKDVIARASFQDYVKKDKEIPAGTHEGSDVYVVDGVAVVKNIASKFYKRANTKNSKDIRVDRYTLYLDNAYTAQFSVDEASRTLTQSEAKNLFINAGYTGLQNSSENYRIDIATTGELTESTSDSTLQTVGDNTEMCDRKASCQLMPMYEDTRKFFTWPDLQVTSGFFDVYHDFGSGETLVGAQDLPAWYYVSASPVTNTYVVPYLPMLKADGSPAAAGDVTVYLNGNKIDDAIDTLDPWNGIVSLNFIPPFDTQLRIDYYYSKRFPDSVYYLRQVVPATIQTPANDLAGIFSVLNVGGVAPRLSWPYAVTDPALYGDDLDHQMDKFPMLNNRGELATKDEITVSIGSIVISGTTTVTEIDNTGSTLHNTSVSDWSGVDSGDVIILQVKNYLDNTLIYVIESVDLMAGTIRLPNSLPTLGSTYPYTIIRFTAVPNAVEAVRPLLGHVRLNFLLPINSFLKVNYYYTPYEREYLMMPDVAVGDTYGASSYTADTFYSSKNRYTLAVDDNPNMADTPYWPFDELLKIGYRYRAFNLPHSGVLNSEQFTLNDYEVNKNKASFAHRSGLLNHYDKMFSPEFLSDTDKNVVLNDRYLQKALPPVTVLNPGTPVFAESFTDDGHYTIASYADEHDTYDPDLVGGRDLRAGFSIIDPDNSGIIDYNPVCGIQDNKQIKLYSDYKEVEFPNGGFDANLTTIDEGGTALPFSFTFIDQYYPNRELRLTEYLDYINQVPTEHRYGTLKILRNSSVIKSIPGDTGIQGNFKALNVGDICTIKSIPYDIEVGYTGYVGYSGTQDLLGYVYGYGSDFGVTGVGETGYDVRRYQDKDYTLIKISDYETATLHPEFKGPGGAYNYEITRDKVYSVDVSLFGSYGYTGTEGIVGNLNRSLVINGDLGHSYSLPDAVLKSLPGYGVTGVNFTMSFADPDRDPTPSNPDNPWIPNPTGISYFNLTQYVVDGKTYHNNRINATTGLVRTSQIIGPDGTSIGLTGMFSGFTGPSGALDLGITGPVGDANPRMYKPSDSYVIPSGDTGIFISYSESEYRVQWRNWDQDMMIVSIGVTGGVFIENTVNMLDDIGEGIVRSFWSVSGAYQRDLRFQGTVIETSEHMPGLDNVLASSYPNGLILLTSENAGHLADTHYKLRRRIIRELLHDNSLNITEIQEFIPLSL
jgi:hypothetical protein